MHPEDYDADQSRTELIAELSAMRAQLATIDNQRQRAEDALRESERRYQLATRAGQVGVWDWDLTTNEIYLDANLKAMLGYEDHEIRNHIDDWGQFVHPEDVDAVMALATAHLTGETPYYEAEHRMLHKDGGIRWFLARGTAIRAPDGTPLRLVGTDTNITERRNIEAARDRLFSLSIDLLCIAGFDGYFKQVNPAWTKSLGWSVSELLEMPWLELVHPDDQGSTLGAGAQLQMGEWVLNFENRYRCKDGSYRWLSWNSYPVQEEQLIFAAVRDITERKKTEADLRRSEKEKSTVLNAVSELVAYQDLEHRIIWANRAAGTLVGLAPEDLVGKKCYEIWHERAVICDACPIARARITRQPEEAEIILQDNRTFAIRGYPVMDADGQLEGVVELAQDVTERRQIEQQRLLAAMERERGNVLQEFINSASHDLNTPLTALKTSLYVLRRLVKREIMGESQALRHVEIMDVQAERLEKLWRDMLHMSRLKMATDFRFVSLDVNQIVQDILHEQHDLILRRCHGVSFTPEADLPPVHGDLANLERALGAIVTNALLYTPVGGTITIQTALQGSSVCIEVSDNGIGIDPADLPHIFDHFFRADSSRSAETGGAGLGLPIAKKVIDAHGGQIEVESVPAEGSLFRVLLPVRG